MPKNNSSRIFDFLKVSKLFPEEVILPFQVGRVAIAIGTRIAVVVYTTYMAETRAWAITYIQLKHIRSQKLIVYIPVHAHVRVRTYSLAYLAA